METKSEFNQSLMAIRDKLPAGYIREVTGGSEAKKACLVRMWQKQSVESMTASEREMLNAVIAYSKKVQNANARLEASVTQIAKSL